MAAQPGVCPAHGRLWACGQYFRAARSERALGDWRNALGPGPLEELRAIVLEASCRQHAERDWRDSAAGPLIVSSLDGTVAGLLLMAS